MRHAIALSGELNPDERSLIRRWSSWPMLVRLLVVAFGVVVFRTAWLCDDAFITYRTVDNFVHGRGLTWNVVERVQAYTHPLWMFLVSAFYAVTREIYFTSLVLSILVSLAAVAAGALRLAVTPISGALGVVVLLSSKAFVDYSTSGLENPLSHLLLVFFLLVYFKRSSAHDLRRLGALALLAAMLGTTRLDLLLICLPVLAVPFWRQRSTKAALVMVLGFSPLVLWELFSLLYYGVPCPNTAYAKLGTSIGLGELARQGVTYLADSFQRDYVTLPSIVVALGIVGSKRCRALIPVAIGLVAYLLYVVRIGGDFMSGRFLAAPLLCAVVIVWRTDIASRWATPAMAVTALVGLLTPTPTLLSARDYGQALASTGENEAIQAVLAKAHGIADERAFYYPTTGLLRALSDDASDEPWPRHDWARQGREHRRRGTPLYLSGNVGIFGYFAGPDIYIVDENALTDPLLARLPVARGWRIGHFERVIPDGYVATIATGRDQICDEELARFYSALTLVTRGPLLDAQRLRAIWQLNTGAYDGLVARGLYASLPTSHNLDYMRQPSLVDREQTAAQHPNDPYALNRLAAALATRGELDRAIPLWEAALELHPENRCMRDSLARARELRQDQPSYEAGVAAHRPPAP